jgi:hypothetical protein
MKELDLLKKNWNKIESEFTQLSENEIYSMLHKKSSSIVKWILIIGIAEVVIWTAVGAIFNTDDYLTDINHPLVLQGLRIFNYFNYAIILGFILLFYVNYRNISTTSSTQKLMKDILKTRRTVQLYVWFNLTVIALSLLLGFIMAVTYSPEVTGIRESIYHDNSALAKMTGLIVLVIGFCVSLFWLIYRMIYGILLKKLLQNYQELKKSQI